MPGGGATLPTVGLRTAITKPQFATGPQKCVVLGPVGESMNALSREPSDIVFDAAMLGSVCARGQGNAL